MVGGSLQLREMRAVNTENQIRLLTLVRNRLTKLLTRIAPLIDASSLICFVPTLAFKLLVFPECWIVGGPLKKWRRH